MGQDSAAALNGFFGPKRRPLQYRACPRTRPDYKTLCRGANLICNFRGIATEVRTGFRSLDRWCFVFGKIYDLGLYKVGHAQIYTTRGIGTVGLPVRFNCPPEVTAITLRA